MVVDVCRATLEAAGKFLSESRVGRPHRPRQPALGSVGLGDRLLDVREGDDRQDRAKLLFVDNSHARLHASEPSKDETGSGGTKRHPITRPLARCPIRLRPEPRTRGLAKGRRHP